MSRPSPPLGELFEDQARMFDLEDGCTTEGMPYFGCFVVAEDSTLELGEDYGIQMTLRPCQPGVWRGLFRYEPGVFEVQMLGAIYVAPGKPAEWLQRMRKSSTIQLDSAVLERIHCYSSTDYLKTLPWQDTNESVSGPTGVLIRSSYITTDEFQHFIGCPRGHFSAEEWQATIRDRYDPIASGEWYGDKRCGHRIGGVVGAGKCHGYGVHVIMNTEGRYTGVYIGDL